MTLSTAFEALPVGFDLKNGKYYKTKEMCKKKNKKNKKKKKKFIEQGPDYYFSNIMGLR